MHPQTKTRRHTRHDTHARFTPDAIVTLYLQSTDYSRSVAVYFACTTGPHGTGAARRSRRNLLNLASHSHLSRCATARARRRMPSLLYALQLYSISLARRPNAPHLNLHTEWKPSPHL
jgi:hypothetical protein